MKWVTHQCVAVGLAAALGLPLPALAGVAAGSVLPDALDQGMARALVFRRAAFNRIHRGVTHWFGWWLALMLPLLSPLLSQGALPSDLPYETMLLFGLGFGGFAHVALDMCTMSGVPVAPWSRKPRIALRLCSTGGLREYLFLAAFLIAMGFFFGPHLLRTARQYL